MEMDSVNSEYGAVAERRKTQQKSQTLNSEKLP